MWWWPWLWSVQSRKWRESNRVLDRRRFSALSYLTHYYDDHDDIEVYEDIFVVKILSFNATYMVVLQTTCGWILVPWNGQYYGLESQRIVRARNPHMTLKTDPKVAWSFKSRRKSAQTRLTFSNKTISSFAEFFYVLHGFYFLLDDILWQGWSEQCIISGDQSISAGPFKRVKYERSSRSREIFWCQIKSRKFLQQICSSHIRVKNYKRILMIFMLKKYHQRWR